jgi:nucleoside-diphosphate-sugar epimerase
MAGSFTPKRPLKAVAVHRKVLVTGASGRIGSYFAQHSHDRYDLRLMVHREEEGTKLRKYGQVVQATLEDLEKLKELCEGIDTVLHLAADPDPTATWDSLLPNNIIGAYNMFAAAKAAGCRRVIYASSIHAISGYPADVQIKAADPVNPGDLYGVTKCFAEALARYMAGQEGLSAIAIRIGAFQAPEAARTRESMQWFDAWISQRDLNQLFQKCIDVEDVQFAIFHGLSDNRFKRMDISNARELVGYAPKDDYTRENPEAAALGLRGKVMSHSLEKPEQSGLRNQTRPPRARARAHPGVRGRAWA